MKWFRREGAETGRCLRPALSAAATARGRHRLRPPGLLAADATATDVRGLPGVAAGCGCHANAGKDKTGAGDSLPVGQEACVLDRNVDFDLREKKRRLKVAISNHDIFGTFFLSQFNIMPCQTGKVHLNFGQQYLIKTVLSSPYSSMRGTIG